MLKLKHNWRDIMLRAWSVRFMALSLFLSGLEVAFPYLQGWLPVPDHVFGLMAGATTALAIYARHIDQEDLPDG